MSKILAKTLYYYVGPMVVAFHGDTEVVLGLVSIENADIFYGPLLTAEELLGYVRGEVDLHMLYGQERAFRKVLWNGTGTVVIDPVSRQEVSEKGDIPLKGAFFMLSHRESGRTLVKEVRQMIMSK